MLGNSVPLPHPEKLILLLNHMNPVNRVEFRRHRGGDQDRRDGGPDGEHGRLPEQQALPSRHQPTHADLGRKEGELLHPHLRLQDQEDGHRLQRAPHHGCQMR